MAGHGLAVVTGGSRGIGKAIAAELAEMGYNLLLVAKEPSKLKATASELSKKYNVKVAQFACDMAETNAIDKLYKFCTSGKLSPTVLVNNAGIFLEGSTAGMEIEQYDKTMSVNVRGMVYLTKKLMPLMKKEGGERIIIISSIWALDSYPVDGRDDGTIYSISKWALRGWARSLRAEARKMNIGVTVIYPGQTFTDEWEGTSTPKERFISPEDIGKVVRAVMATGPQTVIEEVVIRPLKWKYPAEGFD